MSGITIDLTGGAGAAPAARDVPELREGDTLDLPDGATLNADGSVTLRFETPATIGYRPIGGEPRDERIDHLVLRRLTGAQLRRVMSAAAARRTTLLLSLSCGLSEAKLALLVRAMDAPDMTAANMVLFALIDAEGDGLPEHARREDDGGITLPLRYPARDADGTEHTALSFRKMKADALIAMQAAKDHLVTGVHRSTGLSPAAVDALLNSMDAADLNAALRVLGFLSGSGRRTGG